MNSKKDKINIALVAGGYSGEYEISLQSAEQIEENLRQDYNIYKIVITKQEWYHIHEGEKILVDKNDFSLTIRGEKITFRYAFIIIHGTPGENGLLQGYFDMLGIEYNTCDALTSAITFDKVTCNAIVRQMHCVNVANNYVAYKELNTSEEEILKNISLPVFVKPSQGGSSLGTFKVEKHENLMPSINKAYEVHHKVIIEEYIKGREFSCGCMRVDGKITSLPVTEIVPKTEFFDWKAKYDSLSDELVPAPIDKKTTKLIQSTTEQIYGRLSCKGVCRIDYILREKDNALYFLEVNTTPGQSLHSIVPNQVRAMGYDVHWLYRNQIEEIQNNA